MEDKQVTGEAQAKNNYFLNVRPGAFALQMFRQW
jgi:hypothetical protein